MTGQTFTRQYAIRMPNGELFSHAAQPETVVDDFSVPSPMRDMFAFMGLNTPSAKAAGPTGPVIFNNEKDATAKLDELRTQAATVGVSNYGGEVVHRLCTPFTVGRAAEQFLTEVQEWLDTQGGAS